MLYLEIHKILNLCEVSITNPFIFLIKIISHINFIINLLTIMTIFYRYQS